MESESIWHLRLLYSTIWAKRIMTPRAWMHTNKITDRSKDYSKMRSSIQNTCLICDIRRPPLSSSTKRQHLNGATAALILILRPLQLHQSQSQHPESAAWNDCTLPLHAASFHGGCTLFCLPPMGRFAPEIKRMISVFPAAEFGLIRTIAELISRSRTASEVTGRRRSTGDNYGARSLLTTISAFCHRLSGLLLLLPLLLLLLLLLLPGWLEDAAANLDVLHQRWSTRWVGGRVDINNLLGNIALDRHPWKCDASIATVAHSGDRLAASRRRLICKQRITRSSTSSSTRSRDHKLFVSNVVGRVIHAPSGDENVKLGRWKCRHVTSSARGRSRPPQTATYRHLPAPTDLPCTLKLTEMDVRESKARVITAFLSSPLSKFRSVESVWHNVACSGMPDMDLTLGQSYFDPEVGRDLDIR